MHYTQIIRHNPTTGATERPWRDRDHFFTLGDPAKGAERHHKENAIRVDCYSEAAELVHNGHSIRMSDGKSSASLVVPGSLEFVDAPVKRLDDLWTYTMPEPPFSLEDVMSDLRKFLACQAATTYWIAGEEAANAFIGFEFDAGEVEWSKTQDRIDLSRFNLTRLAENAYHSAFRDVPSYSLSEEDADELELILETSLTQVPHRHPNPLDDYSSPLCRTLLAAYFRWQIADGCFLASDKLDQGAIVAISALTGLSANAVRNSLSRDNLSLKKKDGQTIPDYSAILQWIQNRRDFVPLRQEERNEERITFDAIHELKSSPLPEAFHAIHRRTGRELPPESENLEAKIMDHRDREQVPPQKLLRDFARCLGLLPDNFIIEMTDYWETP